MPIHLAYGSNLLPARLAARVPVRGCLGAVTLPGWQLDFAKRGRDGSGKATVRLTGDPADCVHGVAWLLDDQAASQLHRIEGVGVGYDLHTLTVPALGEGFLYVAPPAWRDAALLPYDWYLALVMAGARHHNLPAAWQQRLAQQPARPDPDPARAAAARALITPGHP